MDKILEGGPPMVECGCCGRIHSARIADDCRAWRSCDECGDAYHEKAGELAEHVKTCKGEPCMDYLSLDDQREAEEA